MLQLIDGTSLTSQADLSLTTKSFWPQLPRFCLALTHFISLLVGVAVTERQTKMSETNGSNKTRVVNSNLFTIFGGLIEWVATGKSCCYWDWTGLPVKLLFFMRMPLQLASTCLRTKKEQGTTTCITHLQMCTTKRLYIYTYLPTLLYSFFKVLQI